VTVAAPRRKVVKRVCPGCGAKFEPNHPTRTYCFKCSPPGKWLGAGALPDPLPIEREIATEAFTVAHFCQRARQFKLKDGTNFEPDAYQKAFLEDLFAREPDGRPTFAELWLVVPEGNGKTTFFSLVALYVIAHTPEAWCPVAASARDQGVDLTYRGCQGFVTRNRREDEFRLNPGLRKVTHEATQGALKIFASDAATGDGVDPVGIALIEELHRLVSMELYETWSGKLDKSHAQLIVASTAGEPGSAFEELRDKIRQQATDRRQEGCFLRAAGAGVVLHEWALPEDGDPEDIELVAQANPSPRITVETLKRKRAKPSWNLTHWRRFTCNLPTRESPAISERVWYAAIAEEPIPEGEPVGVGLDLGFKLDTTAAVPLWIPSKEVRRLGPARILVPKGDGTMLHPDEVKRVLREIHARNPIKLAVVDMSNDTGIATWLEDELGAEVVDRQQTKGLAELDYKTFMEALRNGWLKHAGDAGLTKHALNAIEKVDEYGNTRFGRPVEGRTYNPELQRRRVIDALVAATMIHTTMAADLDVESNEILVDWA
jgi:phage terminase large subunit-like protein